MADLWTQVYLRAKTPAALSLLQPHLITRKRRNHKPYMKWAIFSLLFTNCRLHGNDFIVVFQLFKAGIYKETWTWHCKLKTKFYFFFFWYEIRCITIFSVQYLMVCFTTSTKNEMTGCFSFQPQYSFSPPRGCSMLHFETDLESDTVNPGKSPSPSLW